MIVFPDDWKRVGQPISLLKIENTILEILSEIDCNSLALSGGVDSSLLLYYMKKINKKVVAFTMGNSMDHPDVVYAKMAVESIDRSIAHRIFIPDISTKAKANSVYGLFYKFVSEFTDRMVAGDGIDEFACGYYPHQNSPRQSTYYNLLRRLLPEHLLPLNRDSRGVKVYLPYIDKRMIFLLSQIPIYDKVDSKERKKIIMALAKDKVPQAILDRWKYGFCDALNIKEKRYENPA